MSIFGIARAVEGEDRNILFVREIFSNWKQTAQCPFNEYLRRLLHLFIHFILGEGRHEAGEADIEDGLDAVAAREAGHAQPRPARAVLHVQGQPLRRPQLQEAEQWERD